MGIFSISGLLEKARLRGGVFGFQKVAQANTNEPIALLRTEIDPLSQLQGDGGQFLVGGGWGAWRMAAGENLELTCLQLEDNRACHPWFFAGSGPKLFCKAPDHWLGFCQ